MEVINQLQIINSFNHEQIAYDTKGIILIRFKFNEALDYLFLQLQEHLLIDSS